LVLSHELLKALAGRITLQQFRDIVADLKILPVSFYRPPLCPMICLPAAALELRGAGLKVPRRSRLFSALAHLVNTWPKPVTAHTLAAALGSRWASESLDLLWALAHIGWLRPVRTSNRALFFHLEEGYFIGRDL
jgi:hypothetical protein